MLSDAATRHRNDIQSYATGPSPSDSEDDDSSSSPVMDAFYANGGAESICQMTNFTPSEFSTIWSGIETHVLSTWNTGRGRKSSQQPKDVLFMLLTVLKHAGHWDFLGKMFHIKGPTFEKLIYGFLSCISEVLYSTFVDEFRERATMARAVQQGKLFTEFPYCMYATDVTFQQTNRPSGNIQEAKLYFSGKHKLYGYKTEVSVGPRGYAVNCTLHKPGSVADIDIFYGNETFHRHATEKTESDADLQLDGSPFDQSENEWGILADKGYQGSAQLLRVIHPKKKPPRGSLSDSDKEFNRNVSSDRIIVENFFGRMCSLWGLMSHKYRWNEDRYDLFFSACVAFTNVHVRYNPLRSSDSDFYGTVRNRLHAIGVETSRKRKKAQDLYVDRRRLRLSVGVSEMPDSDEE